jgi:basic amino acid/polyamine antiporter, APA family
MLKSDGCELRTTVVDPRSGRLLRILGVTFGIAVGVGDTIGSGILRTPGEVASHLGGMAAVFVIWIVGGLYALLCSSSVTELGTMLPRAGGWYVYSQRAFGERAGFVVGCCDWTMQAVAIAYLAVAMGEFAAGLNPGMAPHVTLVALTGVSALTLLNWIGLQSGSRIQLITSLIKALGLIALIIGCFTISIEATGSAATVAPLGAAKHGLLLGWLPALQAVIVTYDGWYAPIYFTEEDQDPARNLPRSMIGTVLACIAIYLLLNAGLFHALGLGRLAQSQVPAADAAMVLFGSYGKQLILIISVIAVISTINATLLISPRILYGMARDGILPRGLASVNKGGTPAPALLLSALVSVALVVTGTFDTLIAIGSVLFVLVYLSGFLSLLVLRRREPHLPRTYKAWWYPWSTLCVLLASTGFLVESVIGDLEHSLFTVILILLSYLGALAIVRRKAARVAPPLPAAEPGSMISPLTTPSAPLEERSP